MPGRKNIDWSVKPITGANPVNRFIRDIYTFRASRARRRIYLQNSKRQKSKME